MLRVLYPRKVFWSENLRLPAINMRGSKQISLRRLLSIKIVFESNSKKIDISVRLYFKRFRIVINVKCNVSFSWSLFRRHTRTFTYTCIQTILIMTRASGFPDKTVIDGDRLSRETRRWRFAHRRKISCWRRVVIASNRNLVAICPDGYFLRIANITGSRHSARTIDFFAYRENQQHPRERGCSYLARISFLRSTADARV